MRYPHCQSETVVKHGIRHLHDNQTVQYYRCCRCAHSFNDRTGTPMARLRTPSRMVEESLKSHSEGLGIRATGRVYGKSHATMMRWEERLARQTEAWSPAAPKGSDLTLEEDELYPRVGENFPPAESAGGTLTFLKRESRYWVTAQARCKDETLFTQGTQDTWEWVQVASTIRWCTDGERHYGKALWLLASERLPERGLAATYPFRKVWREGWEGAIKIKGYQGQRRVVWLKVDHPFTALSLASEMHANHDVGVRIPEG